MFAILHISINYCFIDKYIDTIENVKNLNNFMLSHFFILNEIPCIY